MKQMPKVGLGTWLLKQDEVDLAVKTAKEVGYKLIDTAQYYNNEYQIGEAIKKYNYTDLWLTSKIIPDNYKNHTMQATKDSVRRLGRNIDLMLLHAPMDNDEINIIAFKELMKAREEGLIRFIGVSNFMPEQIDAIYKATGEYPYCNQIVYTPLTKQDRVVEYCNKNKILITGYSTMRPYLSPRGEEALTDEQKSSIDAIVKSHNSTPGNVLMAWAAQKGIYLIPKSKSPDRIKENFNFTTLTLTEEEMKVIDAMGKDSNIDAHWEAKEAESNHKDGYLYDKNYETN